MAQADFTSGSASDRLAAVRQAINNVLLGAVEWELRGRRVRYPNIKDLYELERRLQEEVQVAAGGGQMASLIQIVDPNGNGC